LEPNLEFSGKTIGNKTADNEQGCCDECNKNYYCKHWTYRAKTKTCELKEAKGKSTLLPSAEGVWSGSEVNVASYGERPFLRKRPS